MSCQADSLPCGPPSPSGGEGRLSMITPIAKVHRWKDRGTEVEAKEQPSITPAREHSFMVTLQHSNKMIENRCASLRDLSICCAVSAEALVTLQMNVYPLPERDAPFNGTINVKTRDKLSTLRIQGKIFLLLCLGPESSLFKSG